MSNDHRYRLELRDGLDGKPIAWAQVLALRTALRVMPFIRQAYSEQMHLAAFRAMFVSWASHRLSPHDFSRMATAAAAGVNWSYRPGLSPTQLQRTIAAAVEAIGAATSSAIHVTARAAAQAAGAEAEEIRSALKQDMELLELGRMGPRELISHPLWFEGQEVSFLELSEPASPFWWDWYARRVAGMRNAFVDEASIDEALTLRIAEQPPHFWSRDSETVNAEISDWIWDAKRKASPESSAPLDYFISYATADEAIAREVASVVAEAGYSSLVQFRDFVPGTNFVREMQRGLASSSRLIALLSPEYEASDHCRAEWAAAYGQDPGGDQGKLLPFLITPTQLNPLAQQVVYRSLVGMTAVERRVAVLEALQHRPRRRTPTEVRYDAAATASPDVRVFDEKLDAIPNLVTDAPVGRRELVDLVVTLREVLAALVDELPENSPKLVRNCLARYRKQLTQRRTQPILELLNRMISAIRREYKSVEGSLWGEGLADLFESLFELHADLKGHFPRSDTRERFFSETPIDEARAFGEALSGPVIEADAALNAVSEAGRTSADFDEIVAGQREQALDLASLPPLAESSPLAVPTPKRRFILSQIGFYERVIAAAAGVAALAAVPAVQAAIPVLQSAIQQLLALLL